MTAKTFDNFFLKQASEWNLSPEDVKRVRSVVDEAIEQVSVNAQGPVGVLVGSDSSDVKVTLEIFPACRRRARREKWSKNRASSAG